MKIKANMNHISNFKDLGLVVMVILLVVVIQLRNHEFLTIENMKDMLKNTAILGILSLGMMMVIITRGIDLSIGASLALVGMSVALIVSRNPTTHPFLAVLLGIVIGTLCGGIVGLVISRGGVSPIIATLGMMSVFRGVTFLISGGSWVSAHQMPNSFKGIATGHFGGINNLVVIAVIVIIVGYYFLYHTKLGRQIYAIGSNTESARISGINIANVTLLVYTIMGALAGLSGVLWVSKFASAQGDTAAGYELKVIAACVLAGVSIVGGEGKILNLIISIIILGILDNALPMVNISPFWQSLIQGIVILFAVIINVMIARKNTYLVLRKRHI